MPSESRFKVGDRVKPSLSALRSKRDHYLDASGSEREKRKGWHDKEAAKRGTVTALNADPRGICSPTLDISWDGGAMSSCLDYTVEHAEPAPTHCPHPAEDHDEHGRPSCNRISLAEASK